MLCTERNRAKSYCMTIEVGGLKKMYRKMRLRLSMVLLLGMAVAIVTCTQKRGGNGAAARLDADTSALTGALLSDAKDIVDLKMKILKAIRYPGAAFAFVLGYTYATGTGSTSGIQGEDMSIVNDPQTAEPTGWQANYRRTDPAAKDHDADKRLGIILTNWGMEALSIDLTGNPTIKALTPLTIDTIEVTNDGDTEAVETYKVAKTISTTYSYSQSNAFNWSAGVSTAFNVGVPLIAGGTVNLSLNFGGSYTFGSQKEIAESTLKDSTIQISVPPHKKMTVDIVVNKQLCTVPYRAKVRILANLTYSGLLRYGNPANPKSRNFNQQFRDSRKNNYYSATFGANNRPFYDDMASQAVNGGLPWLWDEMWAAWGDEGKSHLEALTNPDNFILPITGVLTYEDGLKVTYSIRPDSGMATTAPLAVSGN